MSASMGLALVLAAFVAMMASVMAVAFRERRASRHIGPADTAAQGASDTRILALIFGSIIGGMVLTIITAVLVFF